MKIKFTALFFLLFMFVSFSIAQEENVELSNPVYEFLKDMNVKGIYAGYDDANPNLSRAEVSSFLKNIELKKQELSSSEKSLLEKYKIEFIKKKLDIGIEPNTL